MIGGWLAIGALALAAFALAAFLLRLPREGLTLFGAVLVFGLAGYAWQGSPGQPSAPKDHEDRGANQGEAMVEGRAALFDRTLPPPDYLLTSDAFARRGRFGDAAGLLRRGLEDNPNDLESWLALGLALVGHADGFSNSGGRAGLRTGAGHRSRSSGRGIFPRLCLSAKRRDPRRAQCLGRVDRPFAPEAPWREGLEAEVARLDDMIARAPMLQGQ